MASANTKEDAKKKHEEIKGMAAAAAPAKAMELATEQLQPSPTNPRKRFDEAGLKELGESIAAQGLVQPIVVRPLNGKAKPGGPTHEIVAGERRWRAAKLAGLSRVAVLERTLNDADVVEIQLVENGQREDVTPLEEARAYEQALKIAKYTTATLAKKVGVSERQVLARLALLKLPAIVKKAFEHGRIGPDHAAIIARIPEDRQEEAIRAASAFNGMAVELSEEEEDALEDLHGDDDDDYADRSQVYVPIPIRAFREWVEREVWRKLDAAPWKKDDVDLVVEAGACNACPKSTTVDPGLGPKPGCCIDPVCFEKKMQAFLERRAKEVPLQVSGDYGNRGGRLGQQDYDKAKKPGKDTQEALVMDGAERGHVIHVKLKPSGKARLAEKEKAKAKAKKGAGGKNGKKVSAEEKAELERKRERERQAKQAERAKAEAEVSAKIAVAIIEEAVWPPSRAVLEEIIGQTLRFGQWVQPQYRPFQKQLLQATGVKGTDMRSQAKRGAVSASKFTAMLYYVAVWQYMRCGGGSDIDALAKKLGLDPARIRREHEQQLKVKANSAKDATAAAPAKKKAGRAMRGNSKKPRTKSQKSRAKKKR